MDSPPTPHFQAIIGSQQSSDFLRMCERLTRSLTAGANAVMAMTSLTAALSAIRWGRDAASCVWISNPFGNGLIVSVVWNSLLAALFGFTALRVLSPQARHATDEPASSARSRLDRATLRFLVLATGCAILDMTVFHRLVATGQIVSSCPISLSAVVAVVLVASIVLIALRKRQSSDNANVSGSWQRVRHTAIVLVGLCLGQLLMVLIHILTFGLTDYRRDADVAIVLGARVYSDGTLSLALSDRLQTGVELFDSGKVRALLVSGATGVEGINEAHAMRQFLIEAGIPRDRILVDDRGTNTLETARNAQRLMTEQRLTSALIVSHYFHLAHCKLLFEEQGIRCVTVPARMSRRLVFETYFVARECAGYFWYTLTRPLRPSPPDAA